MKYLIIMAVALSGVFAQNAPAQSVTEQLAECSSFLAKAVETGNACKVANATKQTLLDAQEKLIEKQQEVIASKNEAIEALKESVRILSAMKCNETTISFKPLLFTIWRKKSKQCF